MSIMNGLGYVPKSNIILENIETHLQHPTQRNKALTPRQQLQIALHCLGTGAQYHAIGDMHGISKASINCRVIKRVVYAINNNNFCRVDLETHAHQQFLTRQFTYRTQSLL